MMDYDQEIRLTPTGGPTGPWRASRQVPRGWAELRVAGMPEVHGGGAKDYPAFVECHGHTPHEAVTALYKVLGQCFLAVEERRLRKIELGMNARDIKRTFEVTLEDAHAIVDALEVVHEFDSTKLAIATVRAFIEFVKEAEAQRQGKVPTL